MLTAFLKTLTEIMGGRTQQFAWTAFIAGTVLCGYGKLTGTEYVALVTLLSGIVAGRAVAQDKLSYPQIAQTGTNSEKPLGS